MPNRHLLRNLIANRRFRPTPWPTVGAIAMIVLTASLGNWQKERGHYKDRLQRDYEEAALQSPIALNDLQKPSDIAQQWRYRRVVVHGEYRPSQQIFLDNAIVSGRVGYYVVTPLRVTPTPENKDLYVLVNRGWVAQGATRTDLPKALPPVGTVNVAGRFNLPAVAMELRPQDTSGRVWQRLDFAKYAEKTGFTLVPLLVEQEDQAPDGLVRNWPAPNFGSLRHKIYMVQWYSFAALAALLWVLLNWRKRAPT